MLVGLLLPKEGQYILSLTRFLFGLLFSLDMFFRHGYAAYRCILQDVEFFSIGTLLSKIHYLIIKFEIFLLVKRDEIGQFEMKEHSVLIWVSHFDHAICHTQRNATLTLPSYTLELKSDAHLQTCLQILSP